MQQKALTFHDHETAQKIMAESDPKKIKHLGREVEDFDDEVWKGVSRDVIYKGNLAKFSQNPVLRETLLKTGSKILAEASPHDYRYGIGLGKADPRAQDPSQWRGSNWLGEAIMKVRDELKRRDVDERNGVS